jgi:release factor glutamine methyltransferase
LGLDDRAALLQADWTVPGWSDGVGAPFDLILANPPYVERGAELGPSVRDFEPHHALFAGDDGLDDYRRLVPQVASLMARDGVALFEIGATQADAVSELARAADLTPRLHLDLASRPRVVEMRSST